MQTIAQPENPEHTPSADSPGTLFQQEHRPATTIIAIMAAVLFMGMGAALQGTALSIRANIEGFPEPIFGVIMSMFYAGLAAGIYIAGPVIRTVGYVRSFAAFASIASATAIMHVILVNPYAWVVLRLAHGLCLSVMLVVVESWLNVSATLQNRGRILSLYAVVYHASRGLGQPLIGVFSPASFEIFGVTTVLTSLCLVPLTLAKVTGQPQVRKSPPMLVKTFMRSPLAGSGIVVNGLLFGASWSLIPRYGQQVGIVEAQIGVLMLLVSLGTLAFQWPLGWISDRHDRRKAILMSSVVGFAAALLIAVTRASGGMLFPLVLVFGGFSMPLYSLSIAMMNDQLNRDEMVTAAGAIIVYYGIGSAAGPLIGGLFMSRLGPSGLFYAMALALALHSLFALLRVRITPRIQKVRKSGYRIYPRTSAAAFGLLRKAKRSRARRPEQQKYEKDEQH
ncbi:MAG: MFS transporter [candidate division KSB1 bacterium]|nr:MFS transporter [candidate division KSB1 bacterium]